MTKVMFVNQFGQAETKDMDYIPRIGDIVPVFCEPFLKVKAVEWFPEMIMPELKFSGVDVLVTVE